MKNEYKSEFNTFSISENEFSKMSIEDLNYIINYCEVEFRHSCEIISFNIPGSAVSYLEDIIQAKKLKILKNHC